MDASSNAKSKPNHGKKAMKLNKNKIKIGNSKSQKGPSKKANKKRSSSKGGGRIYLGHIPHGFYEDEMTAYFNQFGKVLAATVARSKKTGRSKGYGFVEFANEEVAKIAAETMNNYLMFNKVLKCRYISPEERKGKLHVKTMFLTSCPRKENRIKMKNEKNAAFNKLTSDSYLRKTQKKMKELEKFFIDRGIDFTMKVNSNKPSNAKSSDSNELLKDSESDSSLNSESDNEAENNQLGVLEIDESDNEIHFKTPPQVTKVFKKSNESPVTPSQRKLNKQSKLKTLKNSNTKSNKTNPKTFKIKETGEGKTVVKSQGIGQKFQKKMNVKEKHSLSKALKVKKNHRKSKAESIKLGVEEILKNNKAKSKVIKKKKPSH